MKKKINIGLNGEITSEDRRKRVEKILSYFQKNTVEIDTEEHDYELNKKRMQSSANIILWCTILGTTLIAMSSLFYMTIPDPTAYVTTQDGRLIKLDPVKKER